MAGPEAVRAADSSSEHHHETQLSVGCDAVSQASSSCWSQDVALSTMLCALVSPVSNHLSVRLSVCLVSRLFVLSGVAAPALSPRSGPVHFPSNPGAVCLLDKIYIESP